MILKLKYLSKHTRHQPENQLTSVGLYRNVETLMSLVDLEISTWWAKSDWEETYKHDKVQGPWSQQATAHSVWYMGSGLIAIFAWRMLLTVKHWWKGYEYDFILHGAIFRFKRRFLNKQDFLIFSISIYNMTFRFWYHKYTHLLIAIVFF